MQRLALRQTGDKDAEKLFSLGNTGLCLRRGPHGCVGEGCAILRVYHQRFQLLVRNPPAAARAGGEEE
jgi:hypothetical protein